jgi:hypothetical protein
MADGYDHRPTTYETREEGKTQQETKTIRPCGVKVP